MQLLPFLQVVQDGTFGGAHQDRVLLGGDREGGHFTLDALDLEHGGVVHHLGAKHGKGQDHDGGRQQGSEDHSANRWRCCFSQVTASSLSLNSWMGRWGRFTRTKALAES